MASRAEQIKKGGAGQIGNRETNGKEVVVAAEKTPWEIEAVRTRAQESDLKRILHWFARSEVARHIALSRDLPSHFDPTNIQHFREGLKTLKTYYQNDEEAGDTTNLIAENPNREPIGIITIRWQNQGRWRGAEFVPKDEQRANLETLIVNPSYQNHHIGTKLTATAIDYAFTTGRNGNPIEEIRGWVLEEANTSRDKIINIFSRLGWRAAADYPTWGEIVRQHVPAEAREEFLQYEAVWYVIRRQWWKDQKEVYNKLSQRDKIKPNTI